MTKRYVLDRLTDVAACHLVCVGVVKEVGPVWIRLHEPELKQLPQTQLQDVGADLQHRETSRVYKKILFILLFSHTLKLRMASERSTTFT